MAEDLISKRLHVAGLTSSITTKDLQDRFSTFGKVTAVDGVGLLDGNGVPRKFAYVSLESSPAKLARCMNLLSGSVWKGAKLKVGEAKPDWKQRHLAEVAAARDDDAAHPSKKRKLDRAIEGREAPDLTPISLETAHDHKYWKVSTLNHIYRPMRMRPLHPIPPLPQQSTTTPAKPTGKAKKPRAREVPKVTRARPVVIDPAKWGRVHVTGALLDAGATILPSATEPSQEPVVKKKEKRAKEKKAARSTTPEPATANVVRPDVKKSAPTPVPTAQKVLHDDSVHEVFEREKQAGLDLLTRMFGKDLEGADTFIDRENDEDVEIDAGPDPAPTSEVAKEETEDEEETEEDQEEAVEGQAEEAEDDEPQDEVEESSTDDGEERLPTPPKNAEEISHGGNPSQPAPPPKPADDSEEILKELFAPREDTGGFAFDLDLDDLDDDPSLLPSPPPIAPMQEISVPRPLDPGQKEPLASLPLFFPTFEADGKPVESPGSIGGRRRGGVRTFWDAAREKGWMDLVDWPRESEEEARARWDNVKGDLTRDWKKRAREARKRKRGTGMMEGMM